MPRTRIVVVVVAALAALAGLLWMLLAKPESRPASPFVGAGADADTPKAPAPNETAVPPAAAATGEAVASAAKAANPPLLPVPSAPSPTPVVDPGPSAPADAGANPMPPPLPSDRDDRAALGDPTVPLQFAYARYLVDRYLLSRPAGEPLPPSLPIDDLFPVEFRRRYGLPVGAVLRTIAGKPAGIPGALDQAITPQATPTWTVKLEIEGPPGNVVQVELAIRR